MPRMVVWWFIIRSWCRKRGLYQGKIAKCQAGNMLFADYAKTGNKQGKGLRKNSCKAPNMQAVSNHAGSFNPANG